MSPPLIFGLCGYKIPILVITNTNISWLTDERRYMNLRDTDLDQLCKLPPPLIFRLRGYKMPLLVITYTNFSWLTDERRYTWNITGTGS